jgi:hypothetical protein
MPSGGPRIAKQPRSLWGAARLPKILHIPVSAVRFARMPTHAMRLHEWGTQG